MVNHWHSKNPQVELRDQQEAKCEQARISLGREAEATGSDRSRDKRVNDDGAEPNSGGTAYRGASVHQVFVEHPTEKASGRFGQSETHNEGKDFGSHGNHQSNDYTEKANGQAKRYNAMDARDDMTTTRQATARLSKEPHRSIEDPLDPDLGDFLEKTIAREGAKNEKNVKDADMSVTMDGARSRAAHNSGVPTPTAMAPDHHPTSLPAPVCGTKRPRLEEAQRKGENTTSDATQQGLPRKKARVTRSNRTLRSRAGKK